MVWSWLDKFLKFTDLVWLSTCFTFCKHGAHWVHFSHSYHSLFFISLFFGQFILFFCDMAVPLRISPRSSHPEVFLRKVVLKICSKFTGEHPCQSVISIKLQSRTPFLRNISGRLLLIYLILLLFMWVFLKYLFMKGVSFPRKYFFLQFVESATQSCS